MCYFWPEILSKAVSKRFIYLFIWGVKCLGGGLAKFFNFKAAFASTLLPLDSAISSATACQIECINFFSSFSSPYIPSL